MSKATKPLITPEQEQRALAIYNALNQSNDLFEQKIKVISTRLKEGGEKKDKDGNILVNDFGEPEKWDNSYYLTYVALNSGGEHTTRITQQQYLDLNINEVYIAKGKIDYRIYKDSYNSVPTIVFNEFIPASTLFVTAMLELEQSLISAKAEK